MLETNSMVYSKLQSYHHFANCPKMFLDTLQNFILAIIFIFPLCILAQNNGNITVGTSITANENSSPWLSPSGDFAFGFQQLQNSTNLFILSIWFNRIPDRTIVWFERSRYPVSRGSTLRLDAAQGLVLSDSGGNLLWNTDGFSDEISHGYLNDTGNFILSGTNSDWLWESFRNPTDTILPTQTIENNDMLNSIRAESDFSGGRFSARMQDGNFVLTTVDVSKNGYTNYVYFRSQTDDANNTYNSGNQLLFSETGSISVTRRNGQQVVLSSPSLPPASDNYYRAALGFDGVFTHYYHPRNLSGNPRWTIAGSFPGNICSRLMGVRGGACGYNGICMIENSRPVCHCPPWFSLIDPNNVYGGCVPMRPPNCVAGENGSAFELWVVTDTDWPQNDYDLIIRTSEDNCRDSCLNDCLCGAAIFRSNNCWKKTLPLSNGRVDTSLGVTAFLKYRSGDIPQLGPNQSQGRRGQNGWIITGSVLLGSSVFINFLVITAACLGFFPKKRTSVFNSVQRSVEANVRYFTYKELVEATNGFEEELGRGAFGIVYKGSIPDSSQSVVAVKKLDRVSEDTEKEFRTEINAIGQTNHKNLVRLLGFCDEGPNRLLVYEYMGNGTVAEFLFGSLRRSWNLRCQIALGVARGLTYLHEECSTQIIHCDIKPQNILIDDYYNGRISDFGLAKLLMMNQTRTWTNIRGTRGYVAPEWFRNTQITAKVDVYSFGALLLEIICCRKNVVNVETFEDEENPILTDWVWDCYQENILGHLVEDDMEALSDREGLERFVMVGLWCIQEDASLRPTMRKASQMLEGIVEVANPPCPSISYSIT